MLRFRALELSDLDLLFQIENDESLSHYNICQTPLSRYALKQYILRAAHEDLYQSGQLRLVVERSIAQQKTSIQLPGEIQLSDNELQPKEKQLPPTAIKLSQAHDDLSKQGYKPKQREVIALLDLTDFSPKHHRAEVGIVLLPQWRQHGMGLACLNLLQSFARDRLSLTQLYAYVLEENHASQRLFRRAGYQEAGRLERWFRIGQHEHTALLFQQLL